VSVDVGDDGVTGGATDADPLVLGQDPGRGEGVGHDVPEVDLGPVELDIQRPVADDDEGPLQRVTMRAPLGEGPKLVQTIKEAAGIRTARKSSGSLRIKVNPIDLG